MGSEWQDMLLEDLADDITVGHVGSMASEYVNEGVPFLRSLNVHPHRIVLDDIRYITTDFHKRLRKSSLRPGDVVIVRTGKPGTCAVVPQWLPEANCSDVVIVRCGPKLNNRFLSYFVNSVAAGHVAAHTVGAVQQHFNVGSARKIRIPLPPLGEQQEIASTLGALDDKISLLRETNATLEAIPQAIFKSWFVDFDPVRAKAEGREPEGVPPEVADLFPSEFEDSELGAIPKGWRVEKVDKILDRLKSKVKFTKEQVNPTGSVPVLEQGTSLVSGFHDGIAQFKATPNDPIFIFGDHTCIFHLSCEHFDIGPNVIPLKGAIRPTHWTFYAVKEKQAFEEYRRHWMELVSKPVVVAPMPICEAFSRIASDIHSRIEANSRQSRTLAEMRDTLLPRLMSGKLRIQDLVVSAPTE